MPIPPAPPRRLKHLDATRAASIAFQDYFEHEKVVGTDGQCWTGSPPPEYLPESLQIQYFTKERVDELCSELYASYEVPPVDTLIADYLKVFATLVYIGSPDAIDKFMEREEYRSDRMPFLLTEGFPESPRMFQVFCEAQWKFCVLPMRFDRKLEYDERRIMPFEVVKSLGGGSSGNTHLIKVRKEYDRIALETKSLPAELPAQSLPRTSMMAPGHDRQYTIKCFRSTEQTQHIARAAWLNETQNYRALERSEHMSKVDGIVRHHGSFRHGSIFCMLLEYANKGNLEQYLQICQPPVTTLDILTFWRSFFSLLDVLIALSRITYEGDDVNYQMCHFDIKPANILVFESDDGAPYHLALKLSDFGSSSHATLLDGSNNLIHQRSGTGTYGAPEAYSIGFSGNTLAPAAVKSNIDLYSLGCIASEIATWIHSGYLGLKQYRDYRSSSNASRDLEVRDAFHDGDKTLALVYNQHQVLKGLITRDCATNVALDRVDSGMLCSNPDERADPKLLMNQIRADFHILSNKLPRMNREALRSSTPESTPFRGHESTSRRLLTIASPAGRVAEIDSRQNLSLEGAASSQRPLADCPSMASVSASRQQRSSATLATTDEDSVVVIPPLWDDISSLATPKLSLGAAKEWKTRSESPSGLRKLFRLSPSPSPYGHFWDRLAKSFEDRRFILLIDNSDTMSGHWDDVVNCAGLLAFATRPYSKLGVELQYTIGTRVLRTSRVSDVEKHVRQLKPTLTSRPHFHTTNMTVALSGALKQFYDHVKSRSSKNPSLMSILHSSPRQTQGLIIFVLTDGQWEDHIENVKKPIKRLIRAIEQHDLDPSIMGIQFVRFGTNKQGWKRMKELDDFNQDIDLVDVEDFIHGDFFKILLGSINKAYDERDSHVVHDESVEAAGSTTPAPLPRTNTNWADDTNSRDSLLRQSHQFSSPD